MAEEIKVIRVGDILTNLIDPVTKLSVQYSKVLNWYDGTPMTDGKLDSYGIYVKKGSEYFLKSLGEYGQILQKNTMTEMRNLSGLEILLLRMGYYNSVQLNGYYQEGDTPAPIEYRLSDTTTSDDGGSVIEVGSIKLEHLFEGEVNTIYFGLNSNIGMTPAMVRVTIQNAIDCATRQEVKRFVVSKGEHITETPSLNYGISDSIVEFKGVLKLKDNDSTPESLTGCRIIGYTGDNIRVLNQKLDGNRDNQAHNPQVGTQFNFTYYKDGGEGISFEGGWSINAIQSHCQFTSKRVFFKDYHMDTSGEHGVYFSITSGGGIPGELLQMDNCSIVNHGIESGGASVTTRAVRRGIYNNCIFDSGSTPKNGQCTHVSAYYAYRGVLLEEGEEFKHVFNNCNFKTSTETIYCVTARADNNTPDPLSVSDHVDLGRGVYINGCTFNDVNGAGVVNMEGSIIRHPEGNLKTYTQIHLPRKVVNCRFYNLYRVQPTESTNVDWENNYFIDSDYEYSGTRVLFDNNLNTDTTTPMVWNFIGNTFINYTNQSTFGIIRNSLAGLTNVKLVIDGNNLIGCTNAVFAYVAATPDVTLINNRDITRSGVRFRFTETATPKLVANNDFIKEEGTVSDRPALNYRYVGQKFYLTTTNSQQRWNGSNWEQINQPSPASTTSAGLMKKSTAISDITTADATDEATAIALANALKVKVQEILTKFRAQDIIDS